jgi:hypothetical protein
MQTHMLLAASRLCAGGGPSRSHGTTAATAGAGNGDSDAEGEEQDEWCPIDQTFDYFKPQPEERWDCETVLSTYSTLDNRYYRNIARVFSSQCYLMQ